MQRKVPELGRVCGWWEQDLQLNLVHPPRISDPPHLSEPNPRGNCRHTRGQSCAEKPCGIPKKKAGTAFQPPAEESDRENEENTGQLVSTNYH